MPDWHAIWNYVRAIWAPISETASSVGVWLHNYVWQTSCGIVEFFFDKIHPHPSAVAATIYLMIILVAATTAILVPKESHIHRVMVRGWYRSAGEHVWIFTLAIFLANGTLHTIEQTNLLTATPLDHSRVPFVEHLSINALLSLSVNVLLWFLVIIFYIKDAGAWKPGNTKRAFVAYFGHIGAAWGSEDVINMYWEHWGTKERIGESVRWLHQSSGQHILVGIIAISTAVGAAMGFRTLLGEVNPTPKFMKLAVFLSIALIAAIALVAFLVSGGGRIAALPSQVISQTN
jgi:hypothetical protein